MLRGRLWWCFRFDLQQGSINLLLPHLHRPGQAKSLSSGRLEDAEGFDGYMPGSNYSRAAFEVLPFITNLPYAS
jgi:hypothetical protein